MDVQSLNEDWQQHIGKQFPTAFDGVEIDDIDLVLLDTFAAGCIMSVIATNGKIDPKKREILVKCKHELDDVVDHLREASEYFTLLQQLASEALTAIE